MKSRCESTLDHLPPAIGGRRSLSRSVPDNDCPVRKREVSPLHSAEGLEAPLHPKRRPSTHRDLVVFEAAAYDGGFSCFEEGLMYDNDAVAQYLYGGVDRMRANIATSQAAYAEASKRAAWEPQHKAAPRMSLAQERRKPQRVELSVE